MIIWLVVLTPLKNIRQWERFSHILWKIKNVWNHQQNMKVNWDDYYSEYEYDDIPNWMEKYGKIHVPKHQPGIDPKSRRRVRLALHISRAMGLLYGHWSALQITRDHQRHPQSSWYWKLMKIVRPWEWEFDIHIYIYNLMLFWYLKQSVIFGDI